MKKNETASRRSTLRGSTLQGSTPQGSPPPGIYAPLIKRWLPLLLILLSLTPPAESSAPKGSAPRSTLSEASNIDSNSPSTRCRESLQSEKSIYASVFETMNLLTGPPEFRGTEERGEKYQRLESEFWSDLENLHRFLTSYSSTPPFYEFLISKNFYTIRESLELNWRLPNKLALELKVLESQGLEPANPLILMRGLLKLMAMQQDLFTNPCYMKDCPHGIKIDQRCIFGNCLPHLAQDFHFEPDGAVNAIWYFEYPVKMKLWGHNVVLRERRELEIDEGTLAIRAQNAAGKSYMESLIKTAQLKGLSGQGWIFVFMDLNNLGLVNYFVEGQKTGDAFIAAFASVLRQNLLSSDHFFRVGGDEFVIISESRNIKNLLILLKSLMDQFYNDVDANALLNNQWLFIERAANEIENLTNYIDLIRSPYVGVLKTDWLIEAAEDFGLFQRNFQSVYKRKILKGVLWQRFLMKPTFSVGSRVIQPKDDYDHLITVTSRQSAESKKIYKEHQGANAIKLGGEKTNETLIEENILQNHLVLPPILTPL